MKRNAGYENINIWVEKLTAFDVVVFVLETAYTGASVRYDEAQITCLAKKMIIFLNKLRLGANFKTANLSSNKADKSGANLTYKMLDNLDEALGKFCKQHLSGQSERFKREVKAYISFSQFLRNMFISLVESELQFSDPRVKNIFYLKRHPLNAVLVDFYRQERKYNIRQSVISLDALKYFIRPAYHFLSIIFLARVTSQGLGNNIPGDKNTIFVEHFTNPFGRVNFTFWQERINKEYFDIVYYFDREDDSCIPHKTDFLEKSGFRWINLHFYSLIRQSKLKIKNVFGIAGIFFSRQPYPAVWFRVYRFEERMWFLLYEGVFKRFKTKIIIQHQETSWVQDVQVRAIESAGGIMIGFNWSNFPYTLEPYHPTPQHVYFVWGKMKKDWVNRKGNTCRFILPSGLWIHEARKDIRLESMRKNFDFILAVFDTSASPVNYISFDSMRKFYALILKLLREHPHWAGIIKGKSYTLEELKKCLADEEIILEIDGFIQEKRLVFLDSTIAPNVASDYADLSVCLSLNTAGIVAGIHGCRAIHWDCSGWSRHPFYADKGQKFIYRDLKDFRQAIIQASKGNKEIGDFSVWRKRFNFFDDFQASTRVGMFIQWYMEGAWRNDDPHDLLGETVKRYIKENKIDDDFFREENLWDNSAEQHLREVDDEVHHRV